MQQQPKKIKKPIGPFSFCPKHNVFYASCKCKIPKSGDKSKETIAE